MWRELATTASAAPGLDLGDLTSIVGPRGQAGLLFYPVTATHTWRLRLKFKRSNLSYVWFKVPDLILRNEEFCTNPLGIKSFMIENDYTGKKRKVEFNWNFKTLHTFWANTGICAKWCYNLCSSIAQILFYFFQWNEWRISFQWSLVIGMGS